MADKIRTLTEAQEDAFAEDACNAIFDAAADHQIGDSMAEIILLDQLLRDCHMADPHLTRAYALATLDFLATTEGSAAETEAGDRRRLNGVALLAAMDANLAAIDDADLVTTIIPGGRLQ